MTLLADVNHLGSEKDLVSTGGLLTVWWRTPSPGLRLPLAFRGSGCHLPASLPLAGGWAGPQPASSPLVFAQSLSCELARLCLRLELFVGKFSLPLALFFSLAVLQFVLLSHISSFRLSSGHSGPVLTLSMQPMPPCPAPATGSRCEHLGYISAGSYS